MRYALIGCGRIAAQHLPFAVESGFEVIALCDLDERAIDGLLADTGLESLPVSRFTDYKEMVERCALDVVAVATDSGSHSEIALYCLSRGISVLVEKPMALSIEDADAMIATAAEQGVFLGVCQQNRLNDSTLLVKEALDRGAFGTLSHVSVQVRWWRDKSYYEQAPWRGTWEQDGGALMNQCIHGFDLMRLFGGEEITEVRGHIANRTHPYLEVEDVGVGYVRFAGGAIGTFEGTTSLYEKNLEECITLIGETGTVVLAGESAQDIEVWHFKDPEVMALLTSFDPPPTDSVYGNSHRRVYRLFKEACEGQGPLELDGHCGKRALELVLAIYKSHTERGPVSLPLDSFSTKGMRL